MGSRSRSGSPEEERRITLEETKDDHDQKNDQEDQDLGKASKERKRRHSSGNASSKNGRAASRSKSRSRSRSRPRRSRSRSPARRRRSRSRTRSRSSSPRRDRGFGGGSNWSFEDQSEDDGFRLHLADLDSQASKRDLEKLFGKYGPLREIWMARSVPCFAFVVFRYREDAEEAQRKVDGQEICSRRVRVTIARPRTRGRGRRGFDPGMRCYQCGERGHFSRDCPDTKWGYRRPPSPRRGSRDDRRDDRRSRY